MAITIKDIARESGVNISTVSRALNDAYGVHQETRGHVLAVAARLNYYPNRVARGLKTRRSHTLALIVSDIRNPFFAEVTRGAEDAARAGGYDLVLCNSDLDPRKQMEYVASLLEKQVDGILMNSVADLSRKQQDQLAASGVPIVLLNRSTASKSFSTVCADNEAGGVMAARYLLRLGPPKHCAPYRTSSPWQPDRPCTGVSPRPKSYQSTAEAHRTAWREQFFGGLCARTQVTRAAA